MATLQYHTFQSWKKFYSSWEDATSSEDDIKSEGYCYFCNNYHEGDFVYIRIAQGHVKICDTNTMYNFIFENGNITLFMPKITSRSTT